MPERVLTLRELNRTHLQRQHLAERSPMTAGDMLRAIVGLQAQEVRDPYLALWSRIDDFQHDDLASMLTDRTAVRASLMRGTIHLVTARDYLDIVQFTWRLHQRAVQSVASAKLVPAEHHAAISARARELLMDASMTAAEIGSALQTEWPQYEARSVSQVVRFLLPLIQTPPRGLWEEGRSPKPSWTMPQGWLNANVIEAEGDPHDIIRRYLRAFGPASLPDMTSWSGVTRLKPAVQDLGDELVTYRNEDGVLLYDLAEMEISSPGLKVPVRFLPGFDNALLGHKDRRRIISDKARALIATQNGMPAATFLVDGYVAGMWRVKDGELQLAQIHPIHAKQQQEVEQEAARMAPFWAGDQTPITWVPVWKEPGKW